MYFFLNKELDLHAATL